MTEIRRGEMRQRFEGASFDAESVCARPMSDEARALVERADRDESGFLSEREIDAVFASLDRLDGRRDGVATLERHGRRTEAGHAYDALVLASIGGIRHHFERESSAAEVRPAAATTAPHASSSDRSAPGAASATSGLETSSVPDLEQRNAEDRLRADMKQFSMTDALRGPHGGSAAGAKQAPALGTDRRLVIEYRALVTGPEGHGNAVAGVAEMIRRYGLERSLHAFSDPTSDIDQLLGVPDFNGELAADFRSGGLRPELDDHSAAQMTHIMQAAAFGSRGVPGLASVLLAQAVGHEAAYLPSQHDQPHALARRAYELQEGSIVLPVAQRAVEYVRTATLDGSFTTEHLDEILAPAYDRLGIADARSLDDTIAADGASRQDLRATIMAFAFGEMATDGTLEGREEAAQWFETWIGRPASDDASAP